MRATRIGWVVLGAAVLAGCDGADRPPPAPLPTDGPNQVVFYVPGMT
jgi:hypothetical protein